MRWKFHPWDSQTFIFRTLTIAKLETRIIPLKNRKKTCLPYKNLTKKSSNPLRRYISVKSQMSGVTRSRFDNNFRFSFFSGCLYVPLQKLFEESATLDSRNIQESIKRLRGQQKAINKKVLQNILEQSGACNDEFEKINETQKQLDEALWVCRKARSFLNFAKTNLTTTSIEILASYRKREVLMDVLKTLNAIKQLVSSGFILQLTVNDMRLLNEDRFRNYRPVFQVLAMPNFKGLKIQ